MKAAEALERLESVGPRDWTPTRMVGYAYLIQQDGWEGLLRYAPIGVDAIRDGFQEASLDPLGIEFTDDFRAFLEELVRSSGHPGAAERARELLEAAHLLSPE